VQEKCSLDLLVIFNFAWAVLKVFHYGKYFMVQVMKWARVTLCYYRHHCGISAPHVQGMYCFEEVQHWIINTLYQQNYWKYLYFQFGISIAHHSSLLPTPAVIIPLLPSLSLLPLLPTSSLLTIIYAKNYY